MTRNEKIIAAVRAGKTYGQVAAKFGVTRSVVAGVLSRVRIYGNPVAYEREKKRIREWHRARRNPDQSQNA